MEKVLDLHIHSKYSRACSPQLTLKGIDAVCRIKGVDIIATGDFTYPQWFSDIDNQLEEIGQSGLYKLKEAMDEKVKFILSTELALIYKDNNKARRIHLILHAPDKQAVRELNKYLDKNFNIRSDGRPILGMSAPELVKICLAINPKFLIYPAHIWTPWFSVFGSKSGFDKMEECFHDQLDNIFAYETGLSSDPEINWMVSELDNYCLLSNSDAHSLKNIAREANVINLAKDNYSEIYNSIKNRQVLKTIEFFPEEGMYHYDGHRDCQISFSPEETKKHQGICPVCKKPLVIGVLNRVYELADRKIGFKPKQATDYIKLVELDKIIAEAMGVKARDSIKVKTIYEKLIKNIGSEIFILTKAGLDKINEIAPPLIAEGIKRAREGKLSIKPGFDGQYGEIRIFSEKELKETQLKFKF